MKDWNEIKDFKNWSIIDKFFFFDKKSTDVLNKLEKKTAQRFLSGIILNMNENSNIRKRALESFMDLVKLQKIKKRVALNLLLDDWIDTRDVFIEVVRLKNLALFYGNEIEEAEEIEEVYYDLIEQEQYEIRCESLFQLGLIYLFKANVMKEKSDYLVCLTKSLQYFERSNEFVENRVDAEFFIITVQTLINIIEEKDWNFEYAMKKTAQLLWQQHIFSFDDTISATQVGLYRTFYAFKKIKVANPNDWLDYRKEFNDLCYYFYELKNQKIKNELLNSISANLIRRSVEPIFSINFNAEICRINKRLNEVNDESKEYAFLSYLKKIASDSKIKEDAEIDLVVSKLLKTFPHLEEIRIEKELKKIDEVHNIHSIMHLFELFLEYS
ncbi:hypothetical protein, partial [Bacillus sp. JJ722]|uniref:hypothetical protein n=1 Tax=Bacillus sp. JJ722 TaxID=3122973 RepID=UPI002FFF6379